MNPWVFLGVENRYKYNSFEAVLNTVSKTFEVEPSHILSKSRKLEYVEPRRVCVFLSYKYKLGSYKKIGEFFNLHHSTAIHQARKFQDLYDTDKNFKTLMNPIL